ncbi:MAG: CDP-glucose 4,6-dehydratase [Limisphaerales bacterium]|jgi:CDP-glucose 4,6-dehydratase
MLATHLGRNGERMFGNHYRKRRVLITGHTGFKGSWLGLWLNELGAEVSGFSDRAPKSPSIHQSASSSVWKNDLRGDIADPKAIRNAISKTKPDIIFHLAAQPLVRLSYEQPMATWQTNIMGTANVLDAVREQKRRIHVVVVTTDKCYENRNWHHGYRESDSLGGHDVYSASKAGAELVTQSMRRSFFEPNKSLGNVASARAGNVIGGGDYAADRIIPDCVNALRAGKSIRVRNPWATRPWQHVLDCLSGYLLLGWKLSTAGKNSQFADAFNFGPAAASNRNVRDLVEEVLKTWPGQWKNEGEADAPHEATLLHLSTDKAAQLLNWFPVWDFESAISRTMEWYRTRHDRSRTDMAEFSRDQIAAFEESARAQDLNWRRRQT